MDVTRASSSLSAGIGLRHPHIDEMRQRLPPVGFMEVHSENYFSGGPGIEKLDELRRVYPLSLHSVGLSLASADGLDRGHLTALRQQADRLRPALVSAHLAWTMSEGVYLNDLLPLPYNRSSLAVVRRNIDAAQQALGRRLLIENLSAYIGFAESEMCEAEFLAELVVETGCGLLLDVNNVFVSAHNLSFIALDYFDRLPGDAIGEIHLAGHARNETEDGPVLIDDHGSRVPDAVWSLYEEALRRFGYRPTLIEWDTDIPPLDVLLNEAYTADALSAPVTGGRHARAA
jgi:uncharacterized protein (UPF0276 family)